MWCNLVVYSHSISSIRFHSIWPTCFELCACTSDREHFTRTSEASAGHIWKLVPYPYPCLCERSLTGCIEVVESHGIKNSNFSCLQSHVIRPRKIMENKPVMPKDFSRVLALALWLAWILHFVLVYMFLVLTYVTIVTIWCAFSRIVN